MTINENIHDIAICICSSQNYTWRAAAAAAAMDSVLKNFKEGEQGVSCTLFFNF
jgi:hypothetical protein